MSAPVHTVILCEDLQLECFVRRFLIKRGWERRQIFSVPLPANGGAGYSWVLKKLPDELKAYRSRNAHAETCLIVGLDADNETIDERIDRLRRACKEADLEFRRADERIALAIPRRNIETWLEYLRGRNVDEVTVYTKYDRQSDCRDQVTRLDDLCRHQRLEPDQPPPSLVFACEEFTRIAR